MVTKLNTNLHELGHERVFSFCEEPDDDEIESGDGLIDVGDGGQRLGGRPGLRAHELGDAVGVPGTVVVRRHLPVLEDLQRGVARNAVLRTQVVVGWREDVKGKLGSIENERREKREKRRRERRGEEREEEKRENGEERRGEE